MKTKNILFFLTAFLVTSGFAADAIKIGIVNFPTCIAESKYGKKEQSNLENIKKQYSSLIEETEKELKSIVKKLEDEEYLEGLSPEATDELKMKYQSLSGDIQKYQSQLYQVMNQAHYFFIQKVSGQIAKASKEMAASKKLELVVNKEACFYNNKGLDITKQIIKVMDKNFEKDEKISKVEEKKEDNIAENKEVKKEIKLEKTKK